MKKLIVFILLFLFTLSLNAQNYFIPDEIVLNKKDVLLTIRFDFHGSKFKPVTGISVSAEGDILGVELDAFGKNLIIDGEGELLTKSKSNLEIKFRDGKVQEISKDKYSSGIRCDYNNGKLNRINRGIADMVMKFDYAGFGSKGPLEKVSGGIADGIMRFKYEDGKIVSIKKDVWSKEVELEYDGDKLLTIGGDGIPDIKIKYKKR